MNEYAIITDSACDLPAQLVDELDISVVPLTLTVDGKSYKNYPDGREIGFHEFYEMLRAGAKASTSAANIDAFIELFEQFAADGKDVLYLGFSPALSGTFNAAKIAAEDVSERYPDHKFYTVDTLCASLGQGLMVYYAAKEREKGRSIDEVRDYVEQNKLHLCHLFTVSDLHFLHRGGRVSKTTAVIGGALGMKPLMHTDNYGRLEKTGVIRGRKQSIIALADRMKQVITDPEGQTVFICQGDCKEDADFLADAIRERLPVGEIMINYTGPVIGAHSGPGTLAVFFMGTER